MKITNVDMFHGVNECGASRHAHLNPHGIKFVDEHDQIPSKAEVQEHIRQSMTTANDDI
jgi:hypothetical protein